MKTKRKFKSLAVQYAYDRYVGQAPERIRSFEDELLNAEIARQVYSLRTQAGLSQHALAKRVGTTASVICRTDYLCRLGDTDYQGHSLSMLRRVATAVGKQLEVRFVEQEREPRSA